MTLEQFDALAELIRLRQARASYRAARLVLVGGMAQADVARHTGLSRSAVGNAVRRCRRAQALCERVAR